MDLHFASAYEAVADRQPDHDALICGAQTRSWRQYDERAARVAGFLDSVGCVADSKVGIYLHNSNAYLEAQFGIFKARGVPVNVNYRYRAQELIYLLDNADAEVVFYQGCYAPRVVEIRGRLPKVKAWVRLDDGSEPLLGGSQDFESLASGHEPMARVERPGSDIYMLYTGGTTGMPKGVMYGHAQLIGFFTRGLKALGLEQPNDVDELMEVVDTLEATRGTGRNLIGCPLMHGTGMWGGALSPQLYGATVVTMSSLGLDPQLIWKEAVRNRCKRIVIVGDAFARPMLDELDRAAECGQPYDLSAVKEIVSSGVMWSSEVKQGLLAHHEMNLVDAMGSTEGAMGSSVMTRDAEAKTAKFTALDGVKVFDEDDREVKPGSGKRGKIATSGRVPLGYYKDPEKSAATFREVEGVRYSFPGDYALVEADGTLTLLGRGSNCINTGGEKVYPEEVEEAIKRHPAVYDCLVVGVADERFGQRIVAVASRAPDAGLDEKSLVDHARAHLSGYKLPRKVVFVDEVKRTASGKADYGWAQQIAEQHISGTTAPA